MFSSMANDFGSDVVQMSFLCPDMGSAAFLLGCISCRLCILSCLELVGGKGERVIGFEVWESTK